MSPPRKPARGGATVYLAQSTASPSKCLIACSKVEQDSCPLDCHRIRRERRPMAANQVCNLFVGAQQAWSAPGPRSVRRPVNHEHDAIQSRRGARRHRVHVHHVGSIAVGHPLRQSASASRGTLRSGHFLLALSFRWMLGMVWHAGSLKHRQALVNPAASADHRRGTCRFEALHSIVSLRAVGVQGSRQQHAWRAVAPWRTSIYPPSFR